MKEKASYRVEEAPLVEEALAKVVDNNFRLIVTDYDLGSRPNGLALLTRLKKEHSRVPIILMSGYDADWLRPLAISRGADFFLQKPFGLGEFLDMTGQALKVT